MSSAEIDPLAAGEQFDVELDRELAKRGLRQFVETSWDLVCTQPLVENFHVHAICEHLQAVTDGQIKNLLINIPPGCSKSLLTGTLWCPWEWSKDASIRWLYFSYDKSVVTNQSGACRKLIEGDWYQARWPHVRMRRDSNLKTFYETTAGGYRKSIRTQGAITSVHPHRLVFDDPHDVKGAKNENKRKGDIDWWDDSVSTRGASVGVRRVGIMQRLHVKDLTGHIMDTDEEGEWEQLLLPMRYEGSTKVTSIGFRDPRTKPGELLAPALISEAQVQGMERKLGRQNAAGQLQQRPTVMEGNLCKADRIQIIPREEYNPRRMKRIVRAWDKAGTKGAGCYTAGPALGEDVDGNIWIVDMAKGQWGTDEVENQISLWSRLDEAKYTRNVAETVFEQEPGASGIQAAKETLRRNRGRRMRAIPPQGNKVVRAEPLFTAINMHEIRMVEGSWNSDLISELKAFPKGEFADQTDGLSLGYSVICGTPTWMPPGDDDGDEESVVGISACANPLCDRLKPKDGEYCCDGCREVSLVGNVELYSCHSDECNARHGQLYARGHWEPASRVKR